MRVRGRYRDHLFKINASVLLILCCVLLLGFSGQKMANVPKPAARLSNMNTENNNAESDLRVIGGKVAAAVLHRDIKALLAYDRVDLRAEDEDSFKDKKSDLYCFVFDSGCMQNKWRSVYEKLSTARELGIKAFVEKSPENGRTYGLLLFYDRAEVPEKSLESGEFLCQQEATKIASWKWEMIDGKWRPVTPLFGYETGALCDGEEE